MAASCAEAGTNISAVLANIFLFFLTMGLAGSVDVAALRAQLHQRTGIICGLCCQFLLMPLISFLVVSAMQPEKHVALTLLILGSSSGGAYSNWWCSLFNADLALSVAMTAVSTLCCSFMLPLNTVFYVNLINDSDVGIPWVSLFKSVGTVFLAITSGVLISTYRSLWKKKMSIVGNLSGVMLILLTLVASTIARPKRSDGGNVGKPPWGQPAAFYATVALPFVVSLTASLCISSLSCLNLGHPERVAITVEVCYQNIGIAAAVALSAFCDDPVRRSDASAVPLVYGLLEALFLGLFCIMAWKLGWTYAPKECSLCEVVRKDFQPSTLQEASSASSSPIPPGALPDPEGVCLPPNAILEPSADLTPKPHKKAGASVEPAFFGAMQKE